MDNKKADPVNTGRRLYHASELLYRVPLIKQASEYMIGYPCTVYRCDSMQCMKDSKLSYLYEYDFDYNVKFLEDVIEKPLAKAILTNIVKFCMQYNPMYYKNWDEDFIESSINGAFMYSNRISTINFLYNWGNLLGDYELVCNVVAQMGYSYIRTLSYNYESKKYGDRGVHYEIMILRPTELKLKKVLQITSNALNAVVDLTSVIPNLPV